MAKKKENFKEMSAAELSKRAVALREELRTLRFKAEGSRSKNVKEEAGIKKNIARILTEIKSKEHAK